MAALVIVLGQLMRFTARNRFLLVWLLLGTLAASVCSLTWPAAHLGDERLPVGNDSFYHARRILDTAANPAAFYEFDPHIHAPEGSLLVWPWGYDYLMGWLTRIGMQLQLADTPIAFLVWIPVAAVFASVSLIMLIAQRMALPLWCSAVAALSVALSPLTQYLHGVGFIDHHFAEYILVLATIFCGLGWLTEPVSTRRAAALGVVLGVAPAFHNGLFILQIPVAATLFFWWLLGRRMQPRAVAWFGMSLLAATIAVLIPSLPFRAGISEYYLLSWFHLYVAAGTALCCACFARFELNARHAGIFAIGATLLLLPLIEQMMLAHSFLAGDVLRLDVISEMQSPLQMAMQRGVMDLANRYSALIWLAPGTLLYCLYMAWQERTTPRLFFWLCAIAGLSLLLTQARLHYFGSFALCIPWLVALQQAVRHRPISPKYLPHAACLCVLLMFAPPMRGQLLGPILPANDPYFTNTRESLRVLAKACRQDPGIVLADHNAGHQIRYYTECDVVADNFLLTPQHEEKIREMERLFATPARDLPSHAPLLKYVLVRPAAIALTETGVMYKSYSDGADQLIADLLLRANTDRTAVPPAYELLYKTDLVDTKNIEIPYLALYKIHRDPGSTVQAAD